MIRLQIYSNKLVPRSSWRCLRNNESKNVTMNVPWMRKLKSNYCFEAVPIYAPTSFVSSRRVLVTWAWIKLKLNAIPLPLRRHRTGELNWLSSRRLTALLCRSSARRLLSNNLAKLRSFPLCARSEFDFVSCFLSCFSHEFYWRRRRTYYSAYFVSIRQGVSDERSGRAEYEARGKHNVMKFSKDCLTFSFGEIVNQKHIILIYFAKRVRFWRQFMAFSKWRERKITFRYREKFFHVGVEQYPVQMARRPAEPFHRSDAFDAFENNIITWFDSCDDEEAGRTRFHSDGRICESACLISRNSMIGVINLALKCLWTGDLGWRQLAWWKLRSSWLWAY